MFLQACSLCCPSGSFSSSGADIWSARPLLPPSHPLIISSLSWLHFALLTCGDVTTFWQQTLPSPKHYTLPFFSENPLSVSAFNFSHLDQHFFFFKGLNLVPNAFPSNSSMWVRGGVNEIDGEGEFGNVPRWFGAPVVWLYRLKKEGGRSSVGRGCCSF